jgi:methyl-accepting chemotaxis protein
MKLKAQIVGFALVGAAVAAAAGSIGLWTTSRLNGAIGAAVEAGSALQLSQEADMMHDAVRGDAQLAMLGALEGDEASLAEAAKGLKVHGETFDEALLRLESKLSSDEVRHALAAVRPLVKQYLSSAARVIGEAPTDSAQAKSHMPGLQADFSALETQLAGLSDLLEANGEAVRNDASARVRQAAMATLAAIVLAAAVMVTTGAWLARRMTAPMAHAVEVAEGFAQGDLTLRIVPSGNEETVRLLDSMARMQVGIGRMVRDVAANAEEVAIASAQIAQGSHELSNRTEQQASSLQETAATMEELGSTVRNNADSAKQASQLALGASGVAVRGGEVMGQVVETMAGINDASHRIADIIGVIDGIAFQTNILALNAAVEAARAGEQGRGFAVVATEVRNLAQRSAAAAREVKTLVNASVERVGAGSLLVNQAGQTMGEIVDGIRRVTDIVGEITSASIEQSAGVSQVGEAVTLMDRNTQQNASLVEEAAAAAAQMSEQAQLLVKAVSAFRVGAAQPA